MPWAHDAWKVGLVLLAALGTLFCMFGVPTLYVIVAYMAGFVDLRHPTGQVLVAQLVGYVPQALFLLAVLPPLAHASLAELGFRTPGPRDIAIALVGVAAMSVVVTVVGSAVVALTHKHDTEAAIELLGQLRTPWQKTAYIAIAIAFAPMIEELTFRVFVFNAFTRYLTIPAAAVASGLAFGLIHAQFKTSDQLIAQLLSVSLPLACGGIVLAYVYATTRCYWASVITHASFNAITVIAVVFFHAK